MPIGDCMQLKRIFMGVHTHHPLECIEEALRTRRIPILQTRAAFTRFEIVLQKDKRYSDSHSN